MRGGKPQLRDRPPNCSACEKHRMGLDEIGEAGVAYRQYQRYRLSGTCLADEQEALLVVDDIVRGCERVLLAKEIRRGNP